MGFNATPTNMTELLVLILAVVAVIMLMRKQYDTNMPLLFYFAATVFTNSVDRPVDPIIFYGSLGFALLLRFEFLNSTFSKLIAFCTGAGLCSVLWIMLGDITA